MVPPAAQRLHDAEDLPQLFDLVKDLVRSHLRTDRAGLMLGLANLGGGTRGLVGGFFQIAGNVIVMNTLPLKRIQETRPTLYKPYAFHILLHEYLHSIGYLSEAQVRPLVLEISEKAFGTDHPVTEFGRGWEKYMPNLVYPVYGWQPQGDPGIEIVRGFDPGASSYIQ